MYNPVVDTDPPVVLQVTAMFVVPVTVAANCCVPPVWTAAKVGEMDTATGAATVTVADADFVVSAALTAVTV